MYTEIVVAIELKRHDYFTTDGKVVR